MPLQVTTPTPVDASILADIVWKSYEPHSITKALVKGPAGRSQLRQWMVGSINETWPGVQRRVVKDTDSGDIISSVVYTFVAKENGEGWKRVPKRPETAESLADVDADVLHKMHATNWEQRVKIMGPEPFIYLNSIATEPAHQRKGAAKMLLDLVAAEAEKHNLPVFLVSSPGAHALYLSNGFVDKGVSEIDLSAGGEPPHKNWAMVRATPRPTEPVSFPELPRRPIKILPMEKTPEDCQQMCEVSQRAFGPDPWAELCFPSTNPEPMESRVQNEMQRIVKPEYMYHKAVDADKQDGEAIGCAKWLFVDDPFEDIKPFSDSLPEGANKACIEATMGKLHKMREEHFRSRKQPYLYMLVLTIVPEAQRRGIGSALLREGLKEADRRGLPTFIDASPAGLGLYKKFGWEEVCQSTVNLKDFGGDDFVSTSVGLIRPPGAKEKNLDQKDIVEGPVA